MDEHTLNDLLECSVCLERLDTSSKVLPCQHTFCRKCLEVSLEFVYMFKICGVLHAYTSTTCRICTNDEIN